MTIKFIQLRSRFIPDNQILQIEATAEWSDYCYLPGAKVTFLSGDVNVIILSDATSSSPAEAREIARNLIKKATQDD